MSKKFFKRCSASLLAAAMSAGLITPALAADPQTPEEPSQGNSEAASLPKNEIFFDEPASQGNLPGGAGAWAGSYEGANRWQQRILPIGNSLMGGSVYGEYDCERIVLNQKTVWNGGPSSKRPDYNGGNIASVDGTSMSEIYKEAVEKFKTNASDRDAWANKLVGSSNGYGSYQRLGDIYINMDRDYLSEEWEEYWRQYWATGTEKTDDRDTSITYTGWNDWAKGESWYEGTEKYTETVGATLEMKFTGVAIRMIGCSNNTMGYMDVSIDGKTVAENVDLKAIGGGDGQTLFSIADLEEGEHTIKIVNKEPLSGTAKKISYDYFEVKSSSASSTQTQELDLNPGNASETGIQYTGGWGTWDRTNDTGNGVGWLNKDEMFIENSSGASIEYTFTGTGIALYGGKHSADNMGSFTWKIDDGEANTVNTKKDSGNIEIVELFSDQNLTNGEHTVTITGVSGKLSLDRLVVTSVATGEDTGPQKPSTEPETHTEATNYRRWLNIDDSIAGVEYDRDETHYTREYLASHPDNVIAIKMTASGAKKLDFDYSLPFSATEDNNYGKTETVTGTISADGKTGNLITTGEMRDNQMKLAASSRVIVNAGTVTYNEDHERLEIRGATEAVIYVSAATDYEDNYPTYRTRETDEQVLARAQRDVDGATAKGYDKVKADHEADYKNIYDRVKLNLGQTKPDLANDDLLAAYNASNSTLTESEKRYCEQLLFQYGRYLQISSSRENAEGRDDQDLPANLQGVWSIYDGAVGNVPWGADYHMNVNMQMNYWPTYSANMAECAIPMIDYEDGLREPGRVTASTYFGIDNSDGKQNGYTAHTQNTPFGWTCPGWAFSWGWSPAAVPWMLQNVYEYYEYGQDVDYLKGKIFPMMDEQAKLYEQILTEITYDNGKTRLATAPSYSAEHGPYTAGNVYENTLYWQLFNDCCEAAEAINAKYPNTVSAERIAKWQDIMEKLDPIEVGASGQIKEWYNETTLGSLGERGHRHMSHLLGLFPGDLINSDNPTYLEAAKVSLRDRGDNATGWGMGQRLNAWARVKDGNHAMTLIKSLFKNGMYVNFWDAHAPFQIDGNFGYTSGIVEMLMQSNASTIELLPAIPDEWADGSVDGIVARGNFELDLDWEDGELTDVEVLSKSGNVCKLNNPAIRPETVAVVDSEGNNVEVTAVEGKDHAIQFDTEANETYTLTVKEVEASSVSMSATAETITAGTPVTFTLNATPEGAAIKSATWSAVDAQNAAVAGVTVTPAANGASASVSVDASVANGTVITVKAANVNGNASLTASKTITVLAADAKTIIELGKHKFVTTLPSTGELETQDGEQVLTGSMDLNDPERKVTNALTSGGSYTVSARLYVPDDVYDKSAGVSDDGKYNSIVSIGDDAFAMRFYTYLNNDTTFFQAYVKTDSGWKTAGSEDQLPTDFFNAWHEVSAVYNSEDHTITTVIDGRQIAQVDAPGTLSSSDKAVEIGHMSDKPDRKNDLKFSNIKIVNKALTPAEIQAAADGTSTLEEENVLLWLDFAGPADEARTALNADLTEANKLVETDYTPASWEAFADAKEKAASMNSIYATAKNLMDAKAELKAAKDALVPAAAATVDTTQLKTAKDKGAQLNLADFHMTEAEKTAFNALLGEAQALITTPTTQEAVNAKAKAVNDAILALRKTPKASALGALKGE